MFAFLNNRRQGTRSRARPQLPGQSKKNDIAMNAMLKLRKFEIDSRVEKKFATNYGKQREMLELLRDLGNEMFEFGHKKAVLKNCIQLGLPLLLVDLICALTKHIKSGTIARGGAAGPCFGVGITHLLNELCSVLRELLYDFPSLCNPSMVGSLDFITHIMHYLLGVNNADTACVLLEEIVAYREKTLRLSDVPHFEKIIMSVSSRQLALFMRIFAILIFEPEKKGNEKDPHHHGGHGESSADESTAGETKAKDESSAAAATSTASGATTSTGATSATTSLLASPSSPSSPSSLSSPSSPPPSPSTTIANPTPAPSPWMQAARPMPPSTSTINYRLSVQPHRYIPSAEARTIKYLT